VVTEFVYLVIAMILVAMCGGFVAAEFSMMTVNRAGVEAAAARGDRRSQGLLKALRTLSTQLSGAQLGITVTNLVIGYLSEPSIASLVRPALTRAGMGETAVSATATTTGLLVASAITMIFGELVPKNLAIAKPLAVGRFVQGFQRLWTRCLAWPIRLFNNNANWVVSKLGIEPQEELATARSAHELASLVRHSAREGTLPTYSADLVNRALAFGEQRARDVMTPWSDVALVDPGTPVDQVILLANQTGHSRFPVIETVSDGARKTPLVRGTAHVRRVLDVPVDKRDSEPVSVIMSAPLLAPESMMLDDLMDQLKHSGMPMALLVDEFGGLSGLVTFEDLVEELVGEVQDEFDPDMQVPTHDGEGHFVLPGRTPVRDASQALGTVLPVEEDYNTIGGLITFRLARFARPGDQICVPTTDDSGFPGRVFTFRVEKTAASGRIETVLAWDDHTPPPPDEPDRPATTIVKEDQG